MASLRMPDAEPRDDDEPSGGRTRRETIRDGARLVAGATAGAQILAATGAPGAVASTVRRAARAAGDKPGYGRLVQSTGELSVPEGFRVVSFGAAGSPMSDGTATPGFHDGSAVFTAGADRVTIIRNHEGYDPGRAIGTANAYDRVAQGGVTTSLFDTRSGTLLGSGLLLNGRTTTATAGARRGAPGSPARSRRSVAATASRSRTATCSRSTRRRRARSSRRPSRRWAASATRRARSTRARHRLHDRGQRRSLRRLLPVHPRRAGQAAPGRAAADAPRAEPPGLRHGVGPARRPAAAVRLGRHPRPRSRRRGPPPGGGVRAGARQGRRAVPRDRGRDVVTRQRALRGERGRRRGEGPDLALHARPPERGADAAVRVAVGDRAGRARRGRREPARRRRGVRGRRRGRPGRDEPPALPHAGGPDREVRAGTVGRSEWSGACYSPDGQWLFVHIQYPGKTFAITGPWERGWM